MNTSEKAIIKTLSQEKNQGRNSTQMLFNWNDCVAETEKEYFSRIRKRRLLYIMKKIMENELDSNQKEVLKMKYFENKSYEEIGKLLYMSASSALRYGKKAEKTVASFMKYVIDFSDMGFKSDDKPLDVKMAIAELLMENAQPEKIGSRLRKTRKDKLISLSQTAFCTGIPQDRLQSIENNGAAYSTELKKLISFYGVSADYIFFGAQ